MRDQPEAQHKPAAETPENSTENPVNNPLSGYVWRRGAMLGLQWLAVFFVVTVGAYLVMGLIGWSGTVRALCAMGIGPVAGTVVIVVWWLVRRPQLGERLPGTVSRDTVPGDTVPGDKGPDGAAHTGDDEGSG